MTNRDYYEVLGVERSATQEEIKRSFKKKAAALHPDNKDTGDESAFKELVAAYEVLSDEQKRGMYDRYGADGVKGNTRFSDGGMDFGGFGDLSDIFDYFFGGGMRTGGGRRANQPQRGADLKFDLELQFHEAVFGCEKEITVKHLEDCTECGATGAAAGYKPVTCTTCNGMGQVRQVASTLFGHFTQVLPCPTCQGEGTKIDHPCGECKGKGQVRKAKTIPLKIPAGVDNGSRMRVGGGGDYGKRGAPAGDLYVVLHVHPHGKLEREGVNVHISLPVSFSMAALGGEVLIETVNGEKVLKIPAGIQTGTVMTMREHGVPHLGSPQRRGDQLVHVVVETPAKLSAEEKQLLKKLAELRGESLTVSPEAHKEHGSAEKSIFDVIAGKFKKNGGDD